VTSGPVTTAKSESAQTSATNGPITSTTTTASQTITEAPPTITTASTAASASQTQTTSQTTYEGPPISVSEFGLSSIVVAVLLVIPVLVIRESRKNR